MHISTLKTSLWSLRENVGRAALQDLNDPSNQLKLAETLKREGLFIQVDGNIKSSDGQRTHPSLLIYSALSLAIYFNEKKALHIRHAIINFLTQNLKVSHLWLLSLIERVSSAFRSY
jgi:hypothetical protein